MTSRTCARILLCVVLAIAVSVPLTTLGLLPSADARDDGEFPKQAPFTDLRFTENGPEIQLDDVWWSWRVIDAVSVDDLVAFAKKTYGRRAEKRLAEDLVEVLTRMKHRPGSTVKLTVADLASGTERVFEDVAMTNANRQAVWRARKARSRAPKSMPPVVQRIDRTHAAKPHEDYADLARVVPGAEGGGALPRALAEQDLDQLEWAVVNRFAYRDRTGVAVAQAFDAVRASIGERVDRHAFAIQLMKLLALFGDGHSRVDVSLSRTLAPGCLPFLIDDAAEGTIAFQADRSAFVDGKRPVVTHLDGRSLDAWIAAAGKIVPRGSSQFVRRQSLRNLRHVNHARRELGLELSQRVTVTLQSLDGNSQRDVKFALVDRKPIYGTWPRGDTRRLGELGYLRISRMSDDAADLAAIDRAFAEFRDTKGLILDVRGNGGGTRLALLRVMPYLMKKDELRVVNVARYRLPPGEKDEPIRGHLENRFLTPPAHPSLSKAMSAALAAHLSAFEPEWSPSESDFSGAHGFVVSAASNDQAYRYEHPVVVLIDAGCFSATDIFVGGLELLPQVTLMGTATGGGSGRTRRVQLVHSGLRVRLSSMVSYRPNGHLYDGAGIAPDLKHAPQTSDLLGTTDTLLDAARARLAR